MTSYTVNNLLGQCINLQPERKVRFRQFIYGNYVSLITMLFTTTATRRGAGNLVVISNSSFRIKILVYNS